MTSQRISFGTGTLQSCLKQEYQIKMRRSFLVIAILLLQETSIHISANHIETKPLPN